MAQKNKVKELVGRGLHSYHTKALQQVDRIEKKNKEQNHKISILSNELDNDYLTKTEEGSVVSLEHSKEGMVYLDELQGNTLVNYCTDGSKEMTLNGDIDVEGTFVTTTEGVDSGKIDVMCEGNTLVNVYSIGKESFVANGNWVVKTPSYKTMVCKPSTLYTFVLYDIENTLNSNGSVQFGATSGDITYTYFTSSKTYVASDLKGIVKFTLTSRDDISDTKYSTRNQLMPSCTEGSLSYNLMILEGDWTNKEVPSEFFIGMKSVGQEDENGHKIEISSSVGKENLIKDSDIYIEQSDTFKTFNSSYQNIIDKVQNKTITISVDIEVEDMIPRTDGRNRIGCELSVVYEDDTRGYHGIWYTGENFKGRQARTFSITKKIKTIDYFGIYIQCAGKKHKIGRPKIEIGDTNTNWCPSSKDNLNGLQTFMNKKEILINEPLRGFEDGKRDRLVKIGNKWFIERNCILLNYADYDWTCNQTDDDYLRAFSAIPQKLSSPITKCNTLLSANEKQAIGFTPLKNCVWVWNVSNNQNYVYISIEKSKLSSLNNSGIKQWIANNPTYVLCQLETPTYEPLEIEPTLNTYNDVTHISNNSIIPCNMKIKNSGYNAIIKPSTLYTVALDTNKSGTIGMNLGGAKVTTTNNVATITTPATLSDDSLRLYGKGIKSSKVRLLEGDKTNWIPSYFEGMKSSFEDKVQEDGTYKMEILSKLGGLNLCTNSDDIRGVTSGGIVLEKVDDKGYKNVTKLSGDLSRNWFSVGSSLVTDISPNTTITISVLARTDKPNNQSKLTFYLGEGQGDYMAFNEPLSTEYKWVSLTRKFKSNSYRPHFGLSQFNGYSVYISKMKIEFGDRMTEWCPSMKDASWSEYKNYNKIQFSSIEPLRAVDYIRDRFVFKNGKPMIERNCKEVVFDGKRNWSLEQTRYWTSITDTGVKGNGSVIKADKYTFNARNSTYSDILPKSTRWGANQNFMINFDEGRMGVTAWKEYVKNNNFKIVTPLAEPTYEEIPFELQKIILEGYENGTLFLDTNIPPTVGVTYAGETPIVKSVRLNKTEVLNNTNDINDNIIPYLMDMDYRVVCLQLATEEIEGGVSMARLFGGAYEMLKRDILSKRLSRQEYGYRLADYFNAGKLTEEQVRELEELR